MPLERGWVLKNLGVAKFELQSFQVLRDVSANGKIRILKRLILYKYFKVKDRWYHERTFRPIKLGKRAFLFGGCYE